MKCTNQNSLRDDDDDGGDIYDDNDLDKIIMSMTIDNNDDNDDNNSNNHISHASAVE